MTVSVCMGLYNGAKYIEEQLYSILNQTKKPDEVILCDDVSTDETVKIVENFICSNHLEENWKIYRNKVNKGYPANFYHACRLCTKNIVFLADQDDIWHSQKIESMCNVFEEQEEAKVVCCKFDLIDSDGKDIHTVMAPTRSGESNRLKKIAMEDIFYKNEYPGMVIAYRNDWGKDWLPDCSKIPHDFLICIRAAEEKNFLQLDRVLAYHRRHNANAGGEEHRIKKLLDKKRKIQEIETYLRMLRSFEEEQILQTSEGWEALEKKLRSMEGRYESLQSGKVGKVIKNAWKYRKNVRLTTVVCDVVIVGKGM